MNDHELGRHLLALGFLTTEQLKHAQTYVDDHPYMSLASVVLYMGYMSPEDLERATQQIAVFQKKTITADEALDVLTASRTRSKELSTNIEHYTEVVDLLLKDLP